MGGWGGDWGGIGRLSGGGGGLGRSLGGWVDVMMEGMSRVRGVVGVRSVSFCG